VSSEAEARRRCPDRLLHAEEMSGECRAVGDDRLAPIAYRRPQSSRAAQGGRIGVL